MNKGFFSQIGQGFSRGLNDLSDNMTSIAQNERLRRRDSALDALKERQNRIAQLNEDRKFELEQQKFNLTKDKFDFNKQNTLNAGYTKQQQEMQKQEDEMQKLNNEKKEKLKSRLAQFDSLNTTIEHEGKKYSSKELQKIFSRFANKYGEQATLYKGKRSLNQLGDIFSHGAFTENLYPDSFLKNPDKSNFLDVSIANEALLSKGGKDILKEMGFEKKEIPTMQKLLRNHAGVLNSIKTMIGDPATKEMGASGGITNNLNTAQILKEVLLNEDPLTEAKKNLIPQLLAMQEKNPISREEYNQLLEEIENKNQNNTQEFPEENMQEQNQFQLNTDPRNIAQDVLGQNQNLNAQNQNANQNQNSNVQNQEQRLLNKTQLQQVYDQPQLKKQFIEDPEANKTIWDSLLLQTLSNPSDAIEIFLRENSEPLRQIGNSLIGLFSENKEYFKKSETQKAFDSDHPILSSIAQLPTDVLLFSSGEGAVDALASIGNLKNGIQFFEKAGITEKALYQVIRDGLVFGGIDAAKKGTTEDFLSDTLAGSAISGIPKAIGAGKKALFPDVLENVLLKEANVGVKKMGEDIGEQLKTEIPTMQKKLKSEAKKLYEKLGPELNRKLTEKEKTEFKKGISNTIDYVKESNVGKKDINNALREMEKRAMQVKTPKDVKNFYHGINETYGESEQGAYQRVDRHFKKPAEEMLSKIFGKDFVNANKAYEDAKSLDKFFTNSTKKAINSGADIAEADKNFNSLIKEAENLTSNHPDIKKIRDLATAYSQLNQLLKKDAHGLNELSKNIGKTFVKNDKEISQAIAEKIANNTPLSKLLGMPKEIQEILASNKAKKMIEEIRQYHKNGQTYLEKNLTNQFVNDLTKTIKDSAIKEQKSIRKQLLKTIGIILDNKPLSSMAQQYQNKGNDND